jgi:pantetheine-phosphate adenylyltransferase
LSWLYGAGLHHLLRSEREAKYVNALGTNVRGALFVYAHAIDRCAEPCLHDKTNESFNPWARMTRIGFYSGSFDPVTLGHTDVIERACRLVEKLVIGIGVHPAKSPLFSADERIDMLNVETKTIAHATGTDIEIVTFSSLAIEAARSHKASVIFRGLRDGADFDYEMQMAGMNGEMAPEVQTVFVAASPNVRHIAANLVRQIALLGGDPSAFVSEAVARRLKAKT